MLEVRVREAVPLLDMVVDEDGVAVSEAVGDSEAVGVKVPVVECEGVVVDDVLLVGRAVRVRVTVDERVGVGVPASSASMATDAGPLISRSPASQRRTERLPSPPMRSRTASSCCVNPSARRASRTSLGFIART